MTGPLSACPRFRGLSVLSTRSARKRNIRSRPSASNFNRSFWASFANSTRHAMARHHLVQRCVLRGVVGAHAPLGEIKILEVADMLFDRFPDIEAFRPAGLAREFFESRVQIIR